MNIQNLSVVCLCLCLKVVASRMRLNNHGYERVIISIGNHVREDPLLIKRLQQYLTVTSQSLFRATKNQIYFRDFVIVIPQNWTTLPHYESATDADVHHAQIIIDKANPAYGEAPYVKQYATCGEAGLYIHLTPNYLLDDEVTLKWGLPEKTLVHEWAHLRWGLFDEYPIDPQDTPFYRHAGKWEPVRCSTEVEGVLRSERTKGECPFDMYTGQPGDGCKFYPIMKHNQGVSSIMFMQYLDSITDFCDDPYSAPGEYRHNVYAPNRQNRLCNYRSAWEVMRKHEDFKKIGAPLPAFTDTSPRFHFVQVKPTRRVLVLDASGSMTGPSMEILRQAASNYILTSVESGSWLGIVQFNTDATTLSEMVHIKSQADRELLTNRLPTYAEGKTSIGAGLGKALTALESSKTGKGGTLILITDGKENKSPWIKDIKPRLFNSKVMIHAIAYTQQAEASIAQLAGETEGRTFFFTGESNSTSLIDGLAATVEKQSFDDFAVSVSSEAAQVLRKTPHVGSFTIDSTIGRETTVTITSNKPVDVVLSDPTEARANTDVFRNSTNGIMTVMIPGLAMKGKWKYTVTAIGPYANALVHVQSKARSKGHDVVHARSWVSTELLTFETKARFTIFADVTRGTAPVLGAKVKATMERPGAGTSEVELLDDGVGSDLIKDDGIYSSYILPRDLKGNGRYNMKVKVFGTNVLTKVITKGHQTGALETGNSGNVMKSGPETESVGDFQRVTTAGEFRVQGYPSVEPDIRDVIPPAKIGDLTVTSFDPDVGVVALEWTAVGDDMGRGRAAGYKIHMSRDIGELLHRIDTTEDISSLARNRTLQEPKVVGLLEQLELQMKQVNKNDTIFLALRAYDDANNYGDTSNIVSVSYVDEVAVPRQRIDVPMTSFLAVIIAPMVGFVLFLVLMTIVCLVWSGKRQTEHSRRKMFRADSTSSLKSVTSEFPHMNYRVDGAYVKRWKEEPSSWTMP
ncbi:calcium-activated chloride channel regulator 1-like [Haliotis rufescens]|uniref:calcium-activated chloride channel regulator 1-like n=1 Tax=Haliotis rufescens TaxID=6454 RepID=UPI00201FA8CB|nr:calcium-activated chloride channel regulator 1-like [Haliotis rufescens]